MAEYIEREAARKLACKICGECDGDVDVCQFRELDVDAIPAADVRPVVRGKWIDNKVAFYLGCSECGCYLEYAADTFLDYGDHYNFCPNCGADMRGTNDEKA